jgi:hypothetical protein
MSPHSERTFFVVAYTSLNGEIQRIPTWKVEDYRGQQFEDFAISEFPLRLVSVVSSRTRVQDDGEDVSYPWWAEWVPGGSRTRVSGWLGWSEFVDRNVFELDGIRVEFKPDLTIVDEIEAAACGYYALWISERVLSHGPHAFITTGSRRNYRALDCRVELEISAWADLPRFFAACEDAIPPKYGPPDYKRSLLDDVRDRFFPPVDTLCLEAFREKARKVGPRVGSFIPCSLWYGSVEREPVCVLEITGQPEPDGRDCILHILSDTASPRIHGDMQLRTRTEYKKRGSGRFKEVLADLGRIVD